MMTFKFGRRALVAGAVAALSFGAPAFADGHKVLESIHFLIPGGAGGGWDGTARGTGEALTTAGLVGSASFENMSGGGGGKAIGYLIENADSNHGTLMVNSTPIVIRSLTGVFPHNFRDLTLVSGTIGDYAAMVVGKDSPINSMADLIAAYEADASGTAIGGGSVPGGMDHLVAAMVMEAAGKDALGVKYLPYDAGGKSMAALLFGGVIMLSIFGYTSVMDQQIWAFNFELVRNIIGLLFFIIPSQNVFYLSTMPWLFYFGLAYFSLSLLSCSIIYKRLKIKLVNEG